MSIIIVSLLFDQLKTALTNCLQSITLLQVNCGFTLKRNHKAISIVLSLHVAMYRFVKCKSCEYNLFCTQLHCLSAAEEVDPHGVNVCETDFDFDFED